MLQEWRSIPPCLESPLLDVENPLSWGNYNNYGPLAIAFGGLIFLGKGKKRIKRDYCLLRNYKGKSLGMGKMIAFY